MIDHNRAVAVLAAVLVAVFHWELAAAMRQADLVVRGVRDIQIADDALAALDLVRWTGQAAEAAAERWRMSPATA